MPTLSLLLKPSGTVGPKAAWRCAAGAFLIGGPVWHFLYLNHYRLADPGAVLAVLVAAVAGALGVMLGRWLPQLFAAVPVAVALALWADLQLKYEAVISTKALAALALLIAIGLGRQREKIIALALGAFYLATLPRFAPPPMHRLGPSKPPTSDGPFLLQIILDGQWGPAGFAASGDSTTGQWLASEYTSRGFRVYSSAYSQFYRTRYSIPQLFALGQSIPLAAKGSDSRNFRQGVVPYFDLLGQRGYRIGLTQTNFLDICPDQHPALDSCTTNQWLLFDHRPYQGEPWIGRFKRISWIVLNANSYLFRSLGIDRDPWRWRSPYGQRGLASIDSLAGEVRRRAAPGVAMVGHFLLPHPPLQLDRACQPVTDTTLHGDAEQSSDLAKLRRAYAEQVRCTHAHITALVDAVDSAVGPGRSIIVISGDHGPRIALPLSPNQPLTPDQLNAFYSTMLVVRGPGISAGEQATPIPLQAWFARFVNDGYQATDTVTWQHLVHRPQEEAQGADTLRRLSVDEMPWNRPGSPR